MALSSSAWLKGANGAALLRVYKGVAFLPFFFLFFLFLTQQQARNYTKLKTQTNRNGQTEMPRTTNRVGAEMGENEMACQQDPGIPLLHQWGPRGRWGIIPGKTVFRECWTSLGILEMLQHMVSGYRGSWRSLSCDLKIWNKAETNTERQNQSTKLTVRNRSQDHTETLKGDTKPEPDVPATGTREESECFSSSGPRRNTASSFSFGF